MFCLNPHYLLVTLWSVLCVPQGSALGVHLFIYYCPLQFCKALKKFSICWHYQNCSFHKLCNWQYTSTIWHWFLLRSVCCWLDTGKIKVINFMRKNNTINHIYKLYDKCITQWLHQRFRNSLGTAFFIHHSKCWDSYMHWHIAFVLLVVYCCYILYYLDLN